MRGRAYSLGLLLAFGCGARSGIDVGPVRPATTPDATPCSAVDSEGEHCNGVDDDCDGSIDEGLALVLRGPPREIRIDEGTTGACTSCRWAIDTTLWSTPTGFVALWRLGFDGLRPTPNTYSRALDLEGRPTGSVRRLFDRPTTNGFRIVSSSRERGALGFCLRVEASDVPATAFISNEGVELAGARAIAPADGCQVVDIVWTGREHLYSLHRATGSLGLDVADEDGRVVRSEIVSPSMTSLVEATTRLSLAHDSVLHVYMRRRDPPTTLANELVVRRLGLDGIERNERVVALPDGFADGPLVAPSADGWLVVAARSNAAGYYAIRVNAAGTPLGSATLRDTTRAHHAGASDLEPRPGGGFYYVATVRTGWPYAYQTILATLDEGGSIVEEIASPPFPDDVESDWVVDPDLVVRGGDVWVLHHGIAPDRDANIIRLSRFGCAPD